MAHEWRSILFHNVPNFVRKHHQFQTAPNNGRLYECFTFQHERAVSQRFPWSTNQPQYQVFSWQISVTLPQYCHIISPHIPSLDPTHHYSFCDFTSCFVHYAEGLVRQSLFVINEVFPMVRRHRVLRFQLIGYEKTVYVKWFFSIQKLFRCSAQYQSSFRLIVEDYQTE